jgi:hypothetical protein
MKKFLFGLLVAALSFSTVNVDAQSAPLKVKTISAADTNTYTNMASRVKSFQCTFTETSGTTAGKIYLEGTTNGTWVVVDSLALVDANAVPQTLVHKPTATYYLSYRFRITNTSSATGTARYAYVRRSDE